MRATLAPALDALATGAARAAAAAAAAAGGSRAGDNAEALSAALTAALVPVVVELKARESSSRDMVSWGCVGWQGGACARLNASGRPATHNRSVIVFASSPLKFSSHSRRRLPRTLLPNNLHAQRGGQSSQARAALLTTRLPHAAAAYACLALLQEVAGAMRAVQAATAALHAAATDQYNITVFAHNQRQLADGGGSDRGAVLLPPKNAAGKLPPPGATVHSPGAPRRQWSCGQRAGRRHGAAPADLRAAAVGLGGLWRAWGSQQRSGARSLSPPFPSPRLACFLLAPLPLRHCVSPVPSHRVCPPSAGMFPGTAHDLQTRVLCPPFCRNVPRHGARPADPRAVSPFLQECSQARRTTCRPALLCPPSCRNVPRHGARPADPRAVGRQHAGLRRPHVPNPALLRRNHGGCERECCCPWALVPLSAASARRAPTMLCACCAGATNNRGALLCAQKCEGLLGQAAHHTFCPLCRRRRSLSDARACQLHTQARMQA